jgi:hypothetical protein
MAISPPNVRRMFLRSRCSGSLGGGLGDQKKVEAAGLLKLGMHLQAPAAEGVPSLATRRTTSATPASFPLRLRSDRRRFAAYAVRLPDAWAQGAVAIQR